MQFARKGSTKEESQIVPDPLTGSEFLCQNMMHTLSFFFRFLYHEMEGLDRYQRTCRLPDCTEGQKLEIVFKS